MTFEELDIIIQRIGGKPTVLEALWDGDTQGWSLLLYVHTIKNHASNIAERHYLGELSLGTDIRLFYGQSYAEIEVAKELGQKAVNKYGLTFYFPSDKAPDDDCPEWNQRHLGINCADCNKLIMPPDSPYLPKDICYNCALSKESKTRHNIEIKINHFIEDGRFGVYKRGTDSIELKVFPICDYLLTRLSKEEKAEKINQEINVLYYDNETLKKIKDSIYLEIEAFFRHYEKPLDLEDPEKQGEVNFKRKVGWLKMVTFEGNEYEIETNKNSYFMYLLDMHEVFENIVSENVSYELHIIKNITYRADSFLRFIHFTSGGTTNVSAINNHYKENLTDIEVLETLKKLEQLGCVEIDKTVLTTTERGKNILFRLN